MKMHPKVSIIINNYNYGKFIREAINSALNQTFTDLEVIVVDDGSTDNSRQIITAYGEKIIPIFKENGGQTSALNLAFSKSFGSIICFIDSDDVLAPSCVENFVRIYSDDNKIVKVHWPLSVIDECGRKTGAIIPPNLEQKNALNELIGKGPDAVLYPPTSGNSWSRSFLEKVMPLPEIEQKIGFGSGSADACLSVLTPLYGTTETIPEPQGFYRIHGANDFTGMLFERRIKRNLALYKHMCSLLEIKCNEKGIAVDIELWKEKSWDHKIVMASMELQKLVPEKTSFLFSDEQQWNLGCIFYDRPVIPFTEKNGQYWGLPESDESAITEIERHRKNGVKHMVIAWPAFWLLDYYSKMNEHLNLNYKCVLNNDRLIVFEL